MLNGTCWDNDYATRLSENRQSKAKAPASSTGGDSQHAFRLFPVQLPQTKRVLILILGPSRVAFSPGIGSG